MKDAPAYDQIIQGLSGMMSITGDGEARRLRVGYPVADTIAGMTAAFAIASALVRRANTGEGAFIDVSMLDSALVAMGWAVSNYLIAGVEPQPHGNDNFTAAPSGAFRAKDGLINIAANKQEQFEALVAGDRARRAGERPALRAAREPQAAPRRADRRARGGASAESACAEWETVFNRIGVPAGCVLTVPQALALPQVRQRELLKTFDDVPGLDRPITVARAGFKLSERRPGRRRRRRPQLGQHTDEVLAAARLQRRRDRSACARRGPYERQRRAERRAAAARRRATGGRPRSSTSSRARSRSAAIRSRS